MPHRWWDFIASPVKNCQRLGSVHQRWVEHVTRQTHQIVGCIQSATVSVSIEHFYGHACGSIPSDRIVTTSWTFADSIGIHTADVGVPWRKCQCTRWADLLFVSTTLHSLGCISANLQQAACHCLSVWPLDTLELALQGHLASCTMRIWFCLSIVWWFLQCFSQYCRIILLPCFGNYTPASLCITR